MRQLAWIVACLPLLLLLAGCTTDEPVWLGDVFISGASKSASYGQLVSVEGSLVVKESSLASLDLPSLRTVAGDVVIERNARLKTLGGLESLVWIGGSLRVEGNPGLVHLAGLDGLMAVGEDLRIAQNPSMESLDGLDRLVEIGGAVSIVGNEALTGLLGLKSVRSIGRGIEIREQPRFDSMDGLQPQTLSGDTKIERYDALWNMKLQAWRRNLWARGWTGDAIYRDDARAVSGYAYKPPLPPISIAPTRPRVEGSHSAEEVEQATTRFLSDFRFCLKYHSDYAARIINETLTLGWTITSGGRVESIRVVASTFPDDQPGNCMTGQLERWRFAGTGARETRVEQSWTFRRETPSAR